MYPCSWKCEVFQIVTFIHSQWIIDYSGWIARLIKLQLKAPSPHLLITRRTFNRTLDNNSQGTIPPMAPPPLLTYPTERVGGVGPRPPHQLTWTVKLQ